MFQIAILDDQTLFREEIYELLTKNQYYPHMSIRTYKSGAELMAALDNTGVDIVLLDIHLKKESGITIGTKLKELYSHSLIIYISRYDYYHELVQSEPFRFLSKPLNPQFFQETINDACKRILTLQKSFFSFSYNGTYYKVNLNDVKYFYSTHRIINLRTQGSQPLHFYGKLDDIQEQIAAIHPDFLRPNKSYLINFNYISSFNRTALLIEEQEISISKQYQQSFFTEAVKRLNI